MKARNSQPGLYSALHQYHARVCSEQYSAAEGPGRFDATTHATLCPFATGDINGRHFPQEEHVSLAQKTSRQDLYMSASRTSEQKLKLQILKEIKCRQTTVPTFACLEPPHESFHNLEVARVDLERRLPSRPGLLEPLKQLSAKSG